MIKYNQQSKFLKFLVKALKLFIINQSLKLTLINYTEIKRKKIYMGNLLHKDIN